MDADFLRLLLFIAGVALILGIYFWDRHKQVNRVVHAIRQAQREGEAVIRNEPEVEEGPEDEEDRVPERIEPGLDSQWMAKQVVRSIARSGGRNRADEQDTAPITTSVEEGESGDDVEAALEQLDALVHEESVDTGVCEQGIFSFAADAPGNFTDKPGDDDLPKKMLQLNVVARGGRFSGVDIAKAAADLQMVYGDMSIYHRYDGDPANGRELYGMAGLVEPGTFPADGLDEFSTPGVTLFAQLPGYQDGMVIFSDMLSTAERLSVMLDGDLQDENHSDLSRQTIGHIREGILEHRRQVQLAHSRRR
ncbi:MAG: cell division protein ZipA C-terminal FtsZ-binding domain-containing protein [Sedimenticola sp.]